MFAPNLSFNYQQKDARAVSTAAMVRFFLITTLITIIHLGLAGNSPPQRDAQSDDDVCSTYAQCGTDGLKYWNMLQTTIAQAAPIDRADGLPIFTKFYAAQPTKQPDDMQTIQQDLINHGFDSNLLSGWETVSKDPRTGASDPPPAAYDNDFDTKNGLLVANGNYRNWDSQKQLPWSEIIYQTWQVAQAHQEGGGPISNLKTIARKNVVNEGTLDVLESLYQTLRMSMGQGDTTWYKWTEEDQPYFFYALLGTDNIKGIIWLLNDHASAIGRKEITEIWTRWPGEVPDMWIEIRRVV
ncbi:MAG: hypothetical protein Q9220_006963 [cf. Caloplaca sp. 1 TL-2023]